MSAPVHRLLIRQGEQQSFLEGELIGLRGTNPTEIWGGLRKDPFKDYFLFATEGAPGEGRRLLLFVSPSHQFSQGLRRHAPRPPELIIGGQETIRPLTPEEVGFSFEFLGEEQLGLGGAELVRYHDNRSEYRVENIQVQVSQGRPPAAREDPTLAEVVRRLTTRLLARGRFNDTSLHTVLQETLALVGGRCWHIGFTAEPTDPDAVRLSLSVSPALDRLRLVGVPERVRTEARAELSRLMGVALTGHPLVSGTPELVPSEEGGNWSWHYPDTIPDTSDVGAVRRWFNNHWEGRPVFVDPIAGEEGEDLLVDPLLAASERMPIPLSVMAGFSQWLGRRLRREPGGYQILPPAEGKEGAAYLIVRRSPFPEIRLHDRSVAAVLEATGVDLSAEQAELAQGTGGWSGEGFDAFLTRIDARYREAGFELSDTTRSEFWKEGGVSYLLPRSRPLIQPGRFTIQGDVLLPGIPEGLLLHDLVLAAPASRAQVLAGISRLRQAYTDAGYVIYGDVPPHQSGWYTQVSLTEEAAGSVTMRVARTGSITVTGTVPESSQQALREAIEMPVGEPFNLKEFHRHLFVAASRLALEPSTVHYSYGGDGHLHVLVTVGPRQSRLFVGGGYSVTEKWLGSIQSELFHPPWAPGTSVVGVELMGSALRQQIGLSATTLPLSDGGVRLAPAVHLGHRLYELDPTGTGEHFTGGHYIGGGGSLGILVPLGDHGIASPWELQLIPGGGYFQRDLPQAGEVVTDRQPYLSGEVGISYRNTGLILPGDQLSGRIATGTYGTLGARDVDQTGTLGGEYRFGLGELVHAERDSAWRLFHLELAGKVGVRRAVHGKLTSDRLFQYHDLPNDFARSVEIGNRPVGDTFGNLALILALQGEGEVWRYLSPFVGVSGATDSLPLAEGRDDDYRVGAALGLRVPAIGLQIYFGRRLYSTSPRWEGVSPWTFGVGIQASSKL